MYKTCCEYWKKNWRNIIYSLVIALVLTLILDLYAFEYLVFYTRWVSSKLTNTEKLELVGGLIIIAVLLIVVLWEKATGYWTRYLNLPEPRHFLVLNYFLIASICPIISLIFKWQVSWPVWIVIAPVYLFIAITYTYGATKFSKICFAKNDLLENILLKDDPINDESKDLIGRSRFVVALKQHIYELSSKEAFVLALYGEWGEGKTSVLNLLKKEVEAERQLPVYEFNPWCFDKESDLTANFYHGLKDFLREHYVLPPTVKGYLELYASLLAKKVPGFELPFKKSEAGNRPIEIKKELEKFIASLGKKILVIIDDIDRLQADQILAVFRLVKLTSHIKNMVFLLSFDWNQVTSILKKSKQVGDPRSYLEKIVQLPLHLPSTDQRMIDYFLLFSPADGYPAEIEKLFSHLGVDENDKEEFYNNFRTLYESELRPVFSTFRSAKRFLNSVSVQLPFVHREVYLYDFFVIEILRVFYPEIYSDINKSHYFYIAVTLGDYEGYAMLALDEMKRKEQIKKHIDELIDKHDSANKKIIISLLENIFPEVKAGLANYQNGSGYLEEYRAKKRVAHPDCFSKYFTLKVPKGMIPDAEIEDMMREWKKSATPEGEIKSSFFDKYQKEAKLVDLLDYLHETHSGKLDKKLVLPLIEVIYKNCAKFRRDGEPFFTEYDKALDLFFSLLLNDKNFTDDKINLILENVVKETKCFDFISNIVLDCHRGLWTADPRYKCITTDELRKLFEQRLEEHFIATKKNIFEEYPLDRQFYFILYQWATRWGEPNAKRQDKVTDYLIGIFKKEPSKAGFFLLKSFVRRIVGVGDRFDDYPKFVAAYNPAKFYECLRELGSSAYSTESEREAVELFMEAHRSATNPQNPSTNPGA